MRILKAMNREVSFDTVHYMCNVYKSSVYSFTQFALNSVLMSNLFFLLFSTLHLSLPTFHSTPTLSLTFAYLSLPPPPIPSLPLMLLPNTDMPSSINRLHLFLFGELFRVNG